MTSLDNISYNYYTDVAMAQHLADYYGSLRWEYKEVNGVKVLKRNKNGFPRTGSNNVKLKRPAATTALIQKHFPKSYMASLNKCAKSSRNAYSQRPRPPALMTKAIQTFIEKDNRYFQKIAQNCSEAANALRQWSKKVNALSNDMRNHCANEAKIIASNNSSKGGSSTIKLTNNRSSSTGKKSTSKNGSSTNTSSTTSAKKISYKKAKSKVKPSKIYPKGTFTPIPTDANQRQIQQYQQNMQRQWNALNQSERRLSKLFENIFWKDFKAQQAKEDRKARREVRAAKSFQQRKFSNYINDWESYISNLSKWLTEYASYIPNPVLNSVEKDLNRAKKNIKDVLKVRREFIRETRNDEDAYAVEGLAGNLWRNFNRSYGRKIRNAQFSGISPLITEVNKNPNQELKAMLADYAYIGYKHAKKYKKGSNSYARLITQYFNDYPQISTMRAELEAERKKYEERKRLSKIRLSVKKIETYSKDQNAELLNRFIDSLTSTNSQNKFQEAFFTKNGSSSLLENLYRKGYREEFLKLANWLDIGKYNKSRLSFMSLKGLILSPDKNQFPNLLSRSYSLIQNSISLTYNPKRMSYYTTKYFNALLSPTESNIKAVYKEAKSYNKSKGSYGIRNNIKPHISSPYEMMLYFKVNDFKYLTRKNKKSSYKYFLGLWTKPIENWNKLEVTYVAENSPAANNGLEVGDKIVRIGLRGVQGFNYEGSAGKAYEKSKNTSMEVLKPDGTLYRVTIPIRIDKDNIKKGFKGTSKVIENPENLPYLSEGRNTIFYLPEAKYSNSTNLNATYRGFDGFRNWIDGYVGTSIGISGLNAKAALCLSSNERKYIRDNNKLDLAFWINDKGEFKVDNNKEKYESKWIKSESIKIGQNNLLSIAKLGSKLQFFINQEFVYEINSYSSSVTSFLILTWRGTSVNRKFLHAYNTSKEEIRSIMVENPPLILDNVLIDESFKLSNKSKYKYFYEKNSSWNNLKLPNNKISHRFVGRWNSDYVELYDKMRGGAKTIGTLTGKVFSGSFELSFDFQHSTSNNSDKAFFINFKKEGVYDQVKKKWDYENHYQWSWVAIRPSSTYLGQKLGGQNKPTENLPAKKIRSMKGRFHNFKAIYNDNILKVFLNGDKIGEIQMRKGTTYWNIFEPRSNGLRVKNLKVISGR